MSLDPEVCIDTTIAMAENNSSEILPYHFEPMSVSTSDRPPTMSLQQKSPT